MEHQIMIIARLASGLFFGWTISSHYPGATMGKACGSGVIKSPLVATILITVFVILGATSESHNVVTTVGAGIIRREDMTPIGAMVTMVTAALLTAANTWMKWPVSTSRLAWLPKKMSPSLSWDVMEWAGWKGCCGAAFPGGWRNTARSRSW